MQLTARDIAQLVGGQLTGNPEELVTGVAGIKEAQPGDVTFVGSPKYLSALKTTRAAVILVAPQTRAEPNRTLIAVENPSQAFAKIVARVAPPPVRYPPGVHPTAVIGPGVRLGRDVSIQPYAVLEAGVVVGNRSVIGAGAYLGHESHVGDDCVLYPHVTLRERTQLGHRVILHGGVVLGADGFGFETVDGRHQKIPQVGTVAIGDDVEIGANSAIDRARFGTTRVGRGTKIDNLVQIGHNCVIGEHCVICGLAGIAGSVIVGNRVTIAGQAGIAGHLTIGDGAIIMAQAGVTKDVAPGAIMLGAPAVPHTKFKRVHGATQRLPDLAEKLRELEQQLRQMQGIPGRHGP